MSCELSSAGFGLSDSVPFAIADGPSSFRPQSDVLAVRYRERY